MGGVAWQIPLQAGQGVQPINSPLQTATQGLDLSRLAGQVAIQKQMQAENDLKIKAAQQEQIDNEATRRGYLEAGDAGDPTQWETLAAKYGASMKAIQQIKDVSQQAALRRAQSKEADLNSSTIQMNHTGASANALLKMAPDEMMAALPDEWARLKAANQVPNGENLPSYADPDSGHVDIDQTRAWLKLHAAHSALGVAMNDAEFKQRQDARAQSEEDNKNAQTRVGALAAQLSSSLTGAEYNRRLTAAAAVDPKTAAQFEPLPMGADPAKPLDPDFQDNVRQRGLNAAQQTTAGEKNKALDIKQQLADAAQEKAKASGGLVGLVQRAYDPTISDAERQGYQEALTNYKPKTATEGQLLLDARAKMREQDRYSQEFNNTYKQEQALWDKAKGYSALAATPDGQMVVDPDKPGQQAFAMDSAHRNYYAGQSQKAQDAAKVLNSQGDQILQKFGWGKYGAPQGGKERTDIPPKYASQIAEGQTRNLKTPDGSTITVKKVNGKIYEISGAQ